MNTKQVIDTTIDQVIEKLKQENMLNYNKKTPFQKAESLLYMYNDFKEAIQDKEERIEEIKQLGIRKKSGSIVKFAGDVKGEFLDETAKAEEQIAMLRNNITLTKNCLSMLDDALDKLKGEPYFDIIRLKYFGGKTLEEIAKYFEIDVSTVSRHKNKLINKLKVKLFSDEVIEYIYS